MSDYHPNLDGPAEPIGLKMSDNSAKERSELASATGSEAQMEARCVWCDFPLSKVLNLGKHISGYCRVCQCTVKGKMKPSPVPPNTQLSETDHMHK